MLAGAVGFAAGNLYASVAQLLAEFGGYCSGSERVEFLQCLELSFSRSVG